MPATKQAAQRGLRVTGSEVVGMLPKKCLVEAGSYFLRKQQWSEGASEEELIDIAIRSMGLSELKPFDPKEKVIEFKWNLRRKKIAGEDEPAPVLQRDPERFAGAWRWFGRRSDGRPWRVPRRDGGQSFRGQTRLGRSANALFSDWAVKGQQLKDELLFLVDEDTAAFNKVMAAFACPKSRRKKKPPARRRSSRPTSTPQKFRFGSWKRRFGPTNFSRRWRRRVILPRSQTSALACSPCAPASTARR